MPQLQPDFRPGLPFPLSVCGSHGSTERRWSNTRDQYWPCSTALSPIHVGGASTNIFLARQSSRLLPNLDASSASTSESLCVLCVGRTIRSSSLERKHINFLLSTVQ